MTRKFLFLPKRVSDSPLSTISDRRRRRSSGGRNSSGAVVGRSATVPEYCFLNFFYRRLPLLLLYLKINSVFTNTQPKSLDLSLIFEFFEEKDEQNHA
jgi:hypothetical protein